MYIIFHASQKLNLVKKKKKKKSLVEFLTSSQNVSSSMTFFARSTWVGPQQFSSPGSDMLVVITFVN